MDDAIPAAPFTCSVCVDAVEMFGLVLLSWLFVFPVNVFSFPFDFSKW